MFIKPNTKNSGEISGVLYFKDIRSSKSEFSAVSLFSPFDKFLIAALPVIAAFFRKLYYAVGAGLDYLAVMRGEQDITLEIPQSVIHRGNAF